MCFKKETDMMETGHDKKVLDNDLRESGPGERYWLKSPGKSGVGKKKPLI